MPTRKHKPRAPQKHKGATRAGFNLKQLRKKIDDLKKKLERHAPNTDQRPAQSAAQHQAAEPSSNPEPAKVREPLLQMVKPAQKPEGKRELARRMMLARIAEARNERTNRSVEADQPTEGSKQ